LFFLDPWGYKGVSLELIASFIKQWGSECILFFNYNRINPGLSNPIVESHMRAIFGNAGFEKLVKAIADMKPADRERTIMEAFEESLLEAGAKYVKAFPFKDKSGARTKHYVIFLTKNKRGYLIMKEIMGKLSSRSEQGVPSFAFNPSRQLELPFSRPLDALKASLLKDFASQTLSMIEIFEKHSIGKDFIERNYKDALLQLESEGKIKASPNASDRIKSTFGGNALVSFPPLEKSHGL
jgi:hypothetical protein